MSKELSLLLSPPAAGAEWVPLWKAPFISTSPSPSIIGSCPPPEPPPPPPAPASAAAATVLLLVVLAAPPEYEPEPLTDCEKDFVDWITDVCTDWPGLELLERDLQRRLEANLRKKKKIQLIKFIYLKMVSKYLKFI